MSFQMADCGLFKQNNWGKQGHKGLKCKKKSQREVHLFFFIEWGALKDLPEWSPNMYRNMLWLVRRNQLADVVRLIQHM